MVLWRPSRRTAANNRLITTRYEQDMRVKVRGGVLARAELLNPTLRNRIRGFPVNHPGVADQEIREIKMHLVPTVDYFLNDLRLLLSPVVTSNGDLFHRQFENMAEVDRLLSNLIVERNLWKGDELPKNKDERIYQKIKECEREYRVEIRETLGKKRFRKAREVFLKVFDEWDRFHRVKNERLLEAWKFLDQVEKRQLKTLEGLGLLKYLDNDKIFFGENGQNVGKMIGGTVRQIELKYGKNVFNPFNPNDLREMVNEHLPENQQLPIEANENILGVVNYFAGVEGSMPNVKEHLEDALGFLETARRDLKLSSKAYEDKDYANATAMLQQAVEKTGKAIGAGMFYIPRARLGDIGHKTPKAFIDIARLPEVQPFVEMFKMTHPGLKTDTGPLENLINNDRVKIAQLKDNEITAQIDLCERIAQNIAKQQGEINDFVDGVRKEYQTIISPTLDERLVMIKNRLGSGVIEGMLCIYILSVITFPHAEYSRYPYAKNESIPLNNKSYTEDLGIVKAMPKIWPAVERAIVSLEGTFKANFELITIREKNEG